MGRLRRVVQQTQGRSGMAHTSTRKRASYRGRSAQPKQPAAMGTPMASAELWRRWRGGGPWPLQKARGAHGCYTQSLPAGGCAVARGTCALGLHPRVAAQVGPPHLCCCLRARCIHVGGMCACAARHGGGAPTSPSGAVGREGAHTSPAPPRPEGPMQPQALPPRESPWVALCLRATRVCKRNQPHQIPSHTGGPILLVSSLLHQTCFRLPRLHLPVPPPPPPNTPGPTPPPPPKPIWPNPPPH